MANRRSPEAAARAAMAFLTDPKQAGLSGRNANDQIVRTTFSAPARTWRSAKQLALDMDLPVNTILLAALDRVLVSAGRVPVSKFPEFEERLASATTGDAAEVCCRGGTESEAKS